MESATGDEEVAALGRNLRGIILRQDLPHLSHLGALNGFMSGWFGQYCKGLGCFSGHLRGIILRQDLPHLSHLGACCACCRCQAKTICIVERLVLALQVVRVLPEQAVPSLAPY